MMNKLRTTNRIGMTLLALAVGASSGFAHCDSMDGPVIADARRALTQQDITPVLKWIPAADEAELRGTFDTTVAIRGEGAKVREVADRHFFETLVRIHRRGEGASFTGLRPAGTVEPPVVAADKALELGDVEALADTISAGVRNAVVERFESVHSAREVADASVEQGRDYVAAYVEYTHFVEAAHQLLAHGSGHGASE